MYTWRVTVRRHPSISPMYANLMRVERIKTLLQDRGFTIEETDRRTVFTVSHTSKYAMDMAYLSSELDYCEVLNV